MCQCSHLVSLHDRFGCLAFLGAFEATRDQRRYCACRIPGGALPEFIAAAQRAVEVELRERRSGAIAQCAEPRLTVIGASAAAVLAELCERIRALDGRVPHLVVHRVPLSSEETRREQG